MDVGEFNGRRLYTGLRLDYRLRLWAPTSASCAISAVAKLLVLIFSLDFIIPGTVVIRHYGRSVSDLAQQISPRNWHL